MQSHDNRSDFARRLEPIIALALGGTLAVVLWMMTPELIGLLPLRWHRRRFGLALVASAVAYLSGRIATRRGHVFGMSTDRLRRLLDSSDRVAMGALSAGVIATCLGFLATWVPHYLLWPWYRDSDTFATLAQSWDAGILPYRDIRGYNFPGAIYLFWVLGKVSGWGRTWPLYAVDAGALILLGAALAAWSRRCSGKVLPGAIAYLLVLTFYLSLNLEIVAQRDWHASLCIVLGLLALQAWPGRSSRIISALLAACALATRPHVVVFLPALWAAVAEGADRRPTSAGAIDHHPRPGLLRVLAEWTIAFGVFAAMAFAPLVIAGIADDLVRGLKVVAVGGPYNRANPSIVAQVFADQFRETSALYTIGLLLLLLIFSRGGERRRAPTWGLALAAALVYRLLHPVQHFYLIYPAMLFSAIAMAIPIAQFVDWPVMAPTLRVIALLLLISESSTGIPRYCDIPATAKALIELARGRTLPDWVPPGAVSWYHPNLNRRYPWPDYRRALMYLRETTDRSTPVANVLRSPPFPSINGPVGRLSPFRAESGICWMWLVDLDLEPEFAVALEGSPDSVVVWAPSDPSFGSRLGLNRLIEVIREHYRFEARFGPIEVWRRATEPR